MQLPVVFWSSGILRLVLGIVPMGCFSLTLSFTNLSFVDPPNPLIGHSYHLHTLLVFVGTRGLTFLQTPSYLRPTLSTLCIKVSVTFWALVRFPCFHLHKVPEGLPSCILRTGSGRTDGRDVYGGIRCVTFTLVFGVGTPLPRRPVMTRHPNTGAGSAGLFFSSQFVRGNVGYLCPVNPYGQSVRLTLSQYATNKLNVAQTITYSIGVPLISIGSCLPCWIAMTSVECHL